MGRFRSLVAQSPAIVISVLAAALSLGGGAYASTHLASGHQSQSGSNAITAGVTWTSLALANGWVSENSTYQSGNPKVALQNGIVYLSGSLAQPSGSSATFATLPASFRPTHNMWITIYTFAGTSGTLYVGHDGSLEAFSNSSCNASQNSAQCFASLATVSYPINS